MTIDEVKKWLNRAYKIDILIKLDIEEMNRISDLINSLNSLDYSKPVVQTSPTSDANYVNDVIKLESIKESYRSKVFECERIKNEIREKIETVDDSTLKAILILRHINFCDWKEISNRIYYHEKYIHRLYKRALEKMLLNVTQG